MPSGSLLLDLALQKAQAQRSHKFINQPRKQAQTRRWDRKKKKGRKQLQHCSRIPCPAYVGAPLANSCTQNTAAAANTTAHSRTRPHQELHPRMQTSCKPLCVPGSTLQPPCSPTMLHGARSVSPQLENTRRGLRLMKALGPAALLGGELWRVAGIK